MEPSTDQFGGATDDLLRMIFPESNRAFRRKIMFFKKKNFSRKGYRLGVKLRLKRKK